MRTSSRSHATVVVVFAVVAILATVSDQVTKVWALENTSTDRIEPFIGSFISFQLVFNPGAAFSLLAHSTWIFTILSVLISIAVLWYLRKVVSIWWTIALGLLFGGAVGNLIDRLVRPPSFGEGHVIDFLNWNGWFVGNVADIYIVVAAALLFLLAILGVPATQEHVEQLRGEKQVESADE
ncbi:MAG TPA: signal peptidase II [Actinomyces sp.]|jgi:signal peptidase II|nr:signal peptidase II [Acidobacteriota bacterium]HHT40159.1 signal peptidase II [Actinomyces sp.]